MCTDGKYGFNFQRCTWEHARAGGWVMKWIKPPLPLKPQVFLTPIDHMPVHLGRRAPQNWGHFLAGSIWSLFRQADCIWMLPWCQSLLWAKGRTFTCNLSPPSPACSLQRRGASSRWRRSWIFATRSLNQQKRLEQTGRGTGFLKPSKFQHILPSLLSQKLFLFDLNWSAFEMLKKKSAMTQSQIRGGGGGGCFVFLRISTFTNDSGRKFSSSINCRKSTVVQKR